MSGSDSDLPLPKTARLVVRVFLAQFGCCHFRAETVSNADAREVLETLSQVDEEHGAPPQSLTRELFLPSDRKAFYHTRREPDPNSPRRSISNVWVWLPDSQAETLEDAQRFFIRHSLPRSEDDISQCELQRVQDTDTAPTVPTRDDTGPRQSKFARLQPYVPHLLAVFCLLFIVVVFVMQSPTSSVSPSPSPVPPPIASHEWNDGAVKFEIRRRLEAAGEPNVDALDPATLLRHFVELFHRPSFTETLTDTQRTDLERFRQSKVPHPFLAFIDRLPDAVPAAATGPKGATWPELAEAHLRPLAKQLQHLQYQSVRGSADPPELMLGLHNILNYKSFFDAWQEDHKEDYDKLDPWCVRDNRSGPENRDFLDGIRKLIQKRYVP